MAFFYRNDRIGRSHLSYAVDDEEGGNEFWMANAAQGAHRTWIHDRKIEVPEALGPVGRWNHHVSTWRTDGLMDVHLNNLRVAKDIQLRETVETDTGIGDIFEYTIQQGGTLVIGQDQDCVGGCMDSVQAQARTDGRRRHLRPQAEPGRGGHPLLRDHVRRGHDLRRHRR